MELNQSSNASQSRTIFLYGPSGSGKSTIGRLLAESLDLSFSDLDEIIETQTLTSIAEIFSTEGENRFREIESTFLRKILEDKPGVVALGGGALLDPNNREIAESTGRVVCFSAPSKLLYKRLESDAEQRPLLSNNIQVNLEGLLSQRADHYSSFPIQLKVDSKSIQSIIWEIQERLGMFFVSGMGSGYDVRVIPGGIIDLGAEIETRDLSGPIALVTDQNVGPLYAGTVIQAFQSAGFDVHQVTIPAGEENKTISTVEYLWESFLSQGIERGSTVVALGGGVVGDLAGFASATYLRGVNWVVLPTTLLAMCDASLGGKTGADLPMVKNLVGAFHPPSFVLVDPNTLGTLPEDEQRNGLAEVVKHGVIADPILFDLCRQGFEEVQKDWDEVVRRAMAVKIRVILDDPYEKGRRASLNLGHTLGHALEAVSGFQLKHGEAVSIGIVAAARIAEIMDIAEKGLAVEISRTLGGLGLPTEIPPGLNRNKILERMNFDKKRSKGKVRFVLPVSIGKVMWGLEVENIRYLVLDYL
jgi:3-dehydroquinate synthase